MCFNFIRSMHALEFIPFTPCQCQVPAVFILSLYSSINASHMLIPIY